MEAKKYDFKIGEHEVVHKHRTAGDSVFNSLNLISKNAIIMTKHLIQLRKIYFNK